MSDRAILVDRMVVPVDDLLTWAGWMEAHKYAVRTKRKDGWTTPESDVTRVGMDEVSGAQVSTVFLGLDHGFGGSPLWFETMIFGGAYGDRQYRYETWDEARAGHERVVAALREGREP